MTKKIRILQLHNLNIGPALGKDPLAPLHSLLDNRKWTNTIDYLVVCGNFTRDQSAESFQQAKTALRDLALKALPAADAVANRLVLVPGPLDVPDPDAERPDFSRFQRFYEDLFREFGVKKTFDPQRAELKDLKDLTLIGLSYWKSSDPGVSWSRIRFFGEMLEKAIRSSNLAYVNTTPTLLISAGTPLFPNGEQWPIENAEVQKVFKTDLRISFHLFGAGPLAYVPPIPFSYNHVSLGLGNESEAGSFWPLRVNLLELGGTPTSDRRLLADWTALRQRASGERWEESTILPALNSTEVPSPEPELEEIYFDFIERLADAIFHQEHAQIIHVQGFPGSGIQDVFDRLRREGIQKVGERQVAIHDHRWRSEADFGGFLLDVSTRRGPAGCAARLIVLYDPSFDQIPREDRKVHIERILESCEGLFSASPAFKLLYLTEFSGISFDGGRRVIELELCAAEHPKDPSSFPDYTYRLPLDGRQVADLTGGYAGLRQGLLHGCEDSFGKWPGSRDIDKRTSAMLLSESFTHREVRDTCRRFLRCIKQMSEGPEVFDYVRKQVLDHYSKPHIGDSEVFGHVEVSFDKIRLSTNSETRNTLASYQIVERIEASNRYRVRVVAPFLARRSIAVYFSYFREDEAYVAQFKELLEKKGRNEKTEIRIYAYLAKDRNPVEAASDREEEARYLAQSRNLCAFRLGRRHSEWVDYELEIWRKRWRRPAVESRYVVLVSREDEKTREMKEGTDLVLPAEQMRVEDVVDKVYSRLAFEEPIWGFELNPIEPQTVSDESASKL